ncbi:delta-12 fatty acid desaturase protein [Neolentinus lepideus HHB14362 ss-1]|uniref:Delta-12 fatty acid desaturase protein n=1 Tax=Neolentinus lepideus HHB14362 ss-1 TaxID=1314782 RepID=A0A165NGJ7_9AGAM|nr:delta-12 fatty acid desaturase protein [Neolentinus lepideus HHB14362 ss-1]
MPGIFGDSQEYVVRTQTGFVPQDIDLNALRASLPDDVWTRNTGKALFALLRLVVSSLLAICAVVYMDKSLVHVREWSQPVHPLLRLVLWSAYWWWQGLVWAGFWSLGHEACHGNISDNKWINHSIGFMLHSWIFLPYFSWRITHLRHHKYTNCIEKEEVFRPHARSELNLPLVKTVKTHDHDDILGETPIVTLGRFLVMQLLGHHTYLIYNTMGSKRYPKGANHFIPSSGLFKKEQYKEVLISDAGLMMTTTILWILAQYTSTWTVFRLYLVPFILTNHWIVAMAFLHHSDPTVPHYREREWTWRRGALSTVDRPFLGWIGNFLLLGVNHNHTAHHLFTRIPFYNLPRATKAIRPLLGTLYNYDSTGVMRALWRSFIHCRFIEDEGDIVFYKDNTGRAHRLLDMDGILHVAQERQE